MHDSCCCLRHIFLDVAWFLDMGKAHKPPKGEARIVACIPLSACKEWSEIASYSTRCGLGTGGGLGRTVLEPGFCDLAA